MRVRTPEEFRRLVRTHYRLQGRDFPWRRTHDPYRILVSEVMLQQTQVERVTGFYKEFLKRFPNVKALARAPLSEVLLVWQGLGYNRRAKFLRAAAQKIMTEHGGKVPSDEAALIALPGIGRNTAGAVMAFAFNKPVVFIETNIRRAFIHYFFPRRKKIEDELLFGLIEKALDRKQPREWYYALMDYGTMLGKQKKIQNPNRRSTAYKKQSAFEGSVRQARGKILKLLSRQRSLTFKSGEVLAGVSREQFLPAVQGLLKEGFLKRRGDHLSLLQ